MEDQLIAQIDQLNAEIIQQKRSQKVYLRSLFLIFVMYL